MRGARHCGVHSKRLASRGSASRPLSAEAWSSWRSVSRRWRALAAMVCVVRPLKATTHDVSPCRRRLHASCCAHVGWTRPRVGSVLRPRQTDRPSGPREVKQRTSRKPGASTDGGERRLVLHRGHAGRGVPADRDERAAAARRTRARTATRRRRATAASRPTVPWWVGAVVKIGEELAGS